MKYSFQDHMTQPMLDALISLEEILAEHKLCLDKLKQIEKIDFSLPQTAANGKPVVHGASLTIIGIEDYWKRRLGLIAQFVPKGY